MASEDKRPPMDPAVVDKLLEALSTDDGFRERFVRDPRAALAEVGHRVDEGAPLLCAQVKTLASKEELSAARKALHAHLTDATSGPMTVIFNFEAGQVQASLGRG